MTRTRLVRLAAAVSVAALTAPVLASTPATAAEIKRTLSISVSASPAAFSPNGDGRFERTTFRYSVGETADVAWQVMAPDGSLARPEQSLGKRAKGTYSFTWDGRGTTGARLPDGTYTVVLRGRTADAAIFPVQGETSVATRIDTMRPAPFSLATPLPGTFYPVVDGYRDGFTARVGLTEIGTLILAVRNAKGAAVRTLVRNAQSESATLTWNGTDAKGRPVSAGSYRYVLSLQDSTGNRYNGVSGVVAVSRKRLVTTRAVRTLSATSVLVERYSGPCSQTATGRTYKGGVDLLSNSRCVHDPQSSDDLAAGGFGLTLPASLKPYTGIQVSTTGRATKAASSPVAAFAYEDTAGNAVGITSLGRSLRTTAAPVAAVTLLVNGRRLNWLVVTASGNHYAVKSFVVRYTTVTLK